MGLDLSYQEGQTPLDEEEKEGLKISSIGDRSELDEFEQKNIEEAVIWTMGKQYSMEKLLSEGFILELHQKMFGEIWRWAGTIRRSDKNIGVHWQRISIELRQLIDDTRYWIEEKIYGEDEIAIRFKYRLVAIHCFQNGNGRHSRMMADLMSVHLFKKSRFSWGSSSLLQPEDARKKYLQSVREADKGNIKPLLKFSRS